MRNKPFPSSAVVARLREEFKKGTRVELVSMDDPYTKLRPGDRGTVIMVDDIGSIHIAWDSGSYLAAVYGEDYVRIVTEDT